MSEADVALRCAWALVDQFAVEGMEHACVSPGSRSTPLALALRRHPGVRVHVHLDERAAAFFGLGIAKATGLPVAVACTSGTAAAGFLPAAVEANLARVPLVLLTADRPPELRGVGANQTIDQAGLYGVHVKRFVDAPVPGDRPDADDWRRLASDALAVATEGPPGPVHLNLPFREPLVPGTVELPDPRWGGPPPAPAPSPDEGDALVDEVANAEHGVLVAGSLREAAPSVAELARVLRWPLVAEPTSGLRVPGALAAGQFLLSNERFATAHAPELVVQVGAAPTSRAGLAFVRSAGRLVIVDPDRLVADPGRTAARTIVAPAEGAAASAIESATPRAGGDWLEGWFDADARARAALDATIDVWDEPYEGRVARDLAASMPEGSTLVVGSSMPVRDLDVYMRPRDGLRVLANRGASGIDGFVSTVLGVAASGASTAALCGDLTLLHDAGSLLWSVRRGHDAVLVVPNNGGGAIFSFLEQRDLPELEELFTTPHGLDLGSVCAAAGAGHHVVERAADLVPVVERARALGGVHVVEVPIDTAANVRRHAEVHEAVADALRPGA